MTLKTLNKKIAPYVAVPARQTDELDEPAYYVWLYEACGNEDAPMSAYEILEYE